MTGKYFFVFFLSMVPIVELRGAIPFAEGFYAADPTFNLVAAYILIVIGNMIPVPFIFFLARRILVWGKDKRVVGKICTFCLEKGHKGGEKLLSRTHGGVYLGLLLFVGIPIPGTGAWTGTLAASLLDMDFKKSVAAIIGGVFLAGVIMMCLSKGIIGMVT